MIVIDLTTTNLNESLNKEIFKSNNGNVRLYDVVFLKGEGISPHMHPYGEDCAFIVEGELDYYISNGRTIKGYENEVLFGWKNVIHGYLNRHDQPLHLLIFVSPNKIGLSYPDDNDEAVIHLSEQERKLSMNMDQTKESQFSTFQMITVDCTYTEQIKKDEIVVLVDIKEKKLYIYTGEDFSISTDHPKIFLKYKSR